MSKKIDVVIVEKIEAVFTSIIGDLELKRGVQITYRNPLESTLQNKVIPVNTSFQIHGVNEMLRTMLTSIKCDTSEVKFENFKQWCDMIDHVSELMKDKPFTLYEDSKNGFTFI